jgi:WD40 repeat protein
MQDLKHEPLSIDAVGFSLDGASFAFKSSDGKVTQYESLSGSQKQSSAGQLGHDKFLAFSNNGFISQSPTGAINLWQSTREVCTTAKPDVVVSVDGDWVCQRGRKLLWLPQSYRPVCVATSDNVILLGHQGRAPTYLEIGLS